MVADMIIGKATVYCARRYQDIKVALPFVEGVKEIRIIIFHRVMEDTSESTFIPSC